jgi:hypothetical protein
LKGAWIVFCIRDRFNALIAALGQVSLRTAHRDPLHAAKHLGTLAAILTTDAENTPSILVNGQQITAFPQAPD